MSETDRAFIKAYQQDYAAPATPHRQPAPVVSYPLPAPTGSPETQRRVDVPQTAPVVAPATRVPTPHLQVAATAAVWQSPAARAAEPSSPNHIPQPHSNAAPQGDRPHGHTSNGANSGGVWGHSTVAPSHAAPAQPAPVPAPPAPSALRIEETLARLDGDATAAPSLQVVETPPLQIVTVDAAAPSPPVDEVESTDRSSDSVQEQPAKQVEAVEIDAPPASETDDGAASDEVTSAPEPASSPSTDAPQQSVSEPPPSASASKEQQPAASEEAKGAETTKAETSDAETHNDTEPSESEEQPSADPTAPFQPQWEVDAFQWPNLINQLTAQANEQVVAACQSLTNFAGEGHTIWAVAGVQENCGATTLALTIARQLAAGGVRVALVDADFDNAALAQRLGVRAEEGWEATLDGRLPLDEVSIASVDDNLVLVPLVAGEGVSSTLASMNAAAQIRSLADEFDMIVIDAGSGSENAAAVATTSDEVLDMTVLLAVDQRQTEASDVDEVIARLKHNQLHSVQLAETFA